MKMQVCGRGDTALRNPCKPLRRSKLANQPDARRVRGLSGPPTRMVERLIRTRHVLAFGGAFVPEAKGRARPKGPRPKAEAREQPATARGGAKVSRQASCPAGSPSGVAGMRGRPQAAGARGSEREPGSVHEFRVLSRSEARSVRVARSGRPLRRARARADARPQQSSLVCWSRFLTWRYRLLLRQPILNLTGEDAYLTRASNG